jgi:membrane-associated protease RseP (regulator of RpoE activity)
MVLTDQAAIDDYVARVFEINDFTVGDSKAGYLLRYRGKLLGDSLDAHARLCEWLAPQQLTPLFRKEADGSHVILLIPSPPEAKPGNWKINLWLFLATVVSVVVTGMGYTDPALLKGVSSNLEIGWITFLHGGLPFAAGMLGILLAHEFGHYLMTRHHKTVASLPYFIPFPTLLGTMGAVILWKQLPRNKRILFDVGVAGPLAGLLVAIPVVLLGLSGSKLAPFEAVSGGFIEGNSLVYLLAKFAVFGRMLPAPASYGDLAPVLYWLKFFFTGMPAPIGGIDVYISPLAMAGWAGLLVTSLNLIPVGQLDGGHVLYVLLGNKTRYVLPVVIPLLAGLGFFWNGWWLWMVMLLFLGRHSADPLDQITELDPARRVYAYLMIVVFMLVFIPVPLILY